VARRQRWQGQAGVSGYRHWRPPSRPATSGAWPPSPLQVDDPTRELILGK
jgi:hypothetical protein